MLFDGIAQPVQGTDARVSAPGEGQLARAAHADHLVVDQVRGHPHQVQVVAALADDLVAGGERNQVGETFQRHAVAILHVFGDRIGERQEARAHSTTVRDCSRRYWAR